MDIKIGKNNRLRLTLNDFEVLKNNFILREVFSLGSDFDINVELIIDKSAQSSKVISRNHTLSFIISEIDLNSLANEISKKSGIKVDNYSVQVDLWGEETRKKRVLQNGS